jgi:hypothetical protein
VDERLQQGTRTDLKESDSTFITSNKSSQASRDKTAEVLGVSPSPLKS